MLGGGDIPGFGINNRDAMRTPPDGHARERGGESWCLVLGDTPPIQIDLVTGEKRPINDEFLRRRGENPERGDAS